MNQYLRNMNDESMSMDAEVKSLLSKQELTAEDFDRIMWNAEVLIQAAAKARNKVLKK